MGVPSSLALRLSCFVFNTKIISHETKKIWSQWFKKFHFSTYNFIQSPNTFFPLPNSNGQGLKWCFNRLIYTWTYVDDISYLLVCAAVSAGFFFLLFFFFFFLCVCKDASLVLPHWKRGVQTFGLAFTQTVYPLL